jgi:tetratricopeptide (TPR) repeat protein
MQLGKLQRSIAKAIELYPDDPLPLIAKAFADRYRALCRSEGMPCSTILMDSSAALQAALARMESTYEATGDKEDKELLSGVLVAQAKLMKDMGQVDTGISACNRALQLFPDSISAKFTLAELLMQKADFEHLSPLLDSILNEAARKQFPGPINLTPEELGEAVLWQYVTLMAADKWSKRSQAHLLLSVYGRKELLTTRMREWLYETTLSKALTPDRYMRRSQGEVDDNSELWVYLSNYMLGKRSDSELLKFEKDAVDRGEMDKPAADCVIKFYMGMKRLYRHEPEKALPLFHQVLETERFEYPEWWVAQSEWSTLQKAASRSVH